MILTGPEIRRQVRSGRIRIDPFDPAHLSPNSYDFTLGSSIKVYKNYVLDPRVPQPVEVIPIPLEGLLLKPSRIYLGHTHETMGSDHYVPIIRGRSSTARLGLFVHVTADIIDIGSHNQWTLQLHAVQPMKIYTGMPIGQVTFWCVRGEVELYEGKYQGSVGPHESQIYREFFDDGGDHAL